MALAVIEINDDAAEEVVKTPECQSYLERVATAALADARAAAPVYTGNYQASLFASGISGPEPAAQLASSSSFWHFVEFGALETPPYHVLGEAAKRQVDRYEDTGKP